MAGPRSRLPARRRALLPHGLRRSDDPHRHRRPAPAPRSPPDPADARDPDCGGNDLLSAYGDTTSARDVITRVQAAVASTLEMVAAALAPAGRLVVGTVYDPSDGTGDAGRLGLPPWPDAVAVIGELNDALREVARASGAAVAEIGQVFQGHGLLAGDITRPQARPVERDVWLCNVIEPNGWGPAAYGRRSGSRPVLRRCSIADAAQLAPRQRPGAVSGRTSPPNVTSDSGRRRRLELVSVVGPGAHPCEADGDAPGMEAA